MADVDMDFPVNETTINCPKCSATGMRNEDVHALFGECSDCNFLFCTNCYDNFHGSEDCPTPPKLIDAAEENGSGDAKMTIMPMTKQTSPFVLPSKMELIECKICYESTPIDNTTDLGCAHLYCNTCVKNYYETLIKDGNVHGLKCPTMNCEHAIPPHTLKELISPEVFARYDSKLLDEILQEEPEIVCCPRPGCGRRFHSQPEFGYCEACDYCFCTNCNQSYHGLTICGESEEQRLKNIKEHLAATTEKEKKRLEKEETRKRKMQDDKSYGLIKKVCKRCPHCRADIEKNKGCDHMTCAKCHTHFCWRCLTILKLRNVYTHISKCKVKSKI